MLVLRWPLFYVMMTSQHKSSDVGSSDMPKRSPKMLSLRGKVQACRKKKKTTIVYIGFCNIYGLGHPLEVLKYISHG